VVLAKWDGQYRKRAWSQFERWTSVVAARIADLYFPPLTSTDLQLEGMERIPAYWTTATVAMCTGADSNNQL